MSRLLPITLLGIALTAVAAAAKLAGLLPAWGLLLLTGVVVGGLFAVIGWGSADPSLGLFGPTTTRVEGAPHIALTFDDGPIPDATPSVLESLARSQARATFFLLVDRAEAHPQLTKQIAAQHEVGLHGLEHTPWLTLRDPEAGAKELRDARARLEAIIERPVTLYRPPFGAVSPRLYESARRAGLKLIWCSVRTRDGGRVSPQAVRERCRRAGPGDIVLLHEQPSASTLPAVLEDLASRGLRSVTVGSLCTSV